MSNSKAAASASGAEVLQVQRAQRAQRVLVCLSLSIYTHIHRCIHVHQIHTPQSKRMGIPAVGFRYVLCWYLDRPPIYGNPFRVTASAWGKQRSASGTQRYLSIAVCNNLRPLIWTPRHLLEKKRTPPEGASA